MNNNLVNKNTSQIANLFQTVCSKLSYTREDYYFVSQVQKFSTDALDRVSIDLISQYEKKYINSFYNFLESEYQISVSDNFEKRIGSNSVTVKIVNYLLEFQKKFNFIKRYISIKSLDDFNEYKGILEAYFSQLDFEDSSSDIKFDILSDIPNDISVVLLKKGFLGARTTLKMNVIESPSGYYVNTVEHVPTEYRLSNQDHQLTLSLT